MLKPLKSKRGFTLLEILLVVGIIAILAGVVIVAINPNRQLKLVRDTERKSDISEINKAMIQFYIDKGYYPASTTLGDTLGTSTPAEICNTGATTGGSVDCTDLVDLSELVPVYLTAIPTDPSTDSGSPGAGYSVSVPSTKKLYVEAPDTELIGTGATVAYVGPVPAGHTPTAPGGGGDTEPDDNDVTNYILDTYSSGLLAAYSLRVLSSDFENSDLVLVRREDNSEMGFNAAEISDGTLEDWVGVGGYGYVKTWYDQSGNGNNATQNNNDEQPTIVASGYLIEKNSQPAILFAYEGFAAKNTLSLDNRITNVLSSFNVFTSEVLTGNFSSFIFGDTSTYFYHPPGGDPSGWVGSQYGSSAVIDGSNYLNGNSFSITSARVADQVLLTMIHTSPTTIGTLSKDRSEPVDRSWRGTRQEIIIYSTNQSSNRIAIEEDINSYYSIY